MKVTITNPVLNTSITISDDDLKNENEIMIEVADSEEMIYTTINNLKDFDDLISNLEEFRRRMRKQLSE